MVIFHSYVSLPKGILSFGSINSGPDETCVDFTQPALLHGGLIGAAQGQNAPHEVAEGQGFTIFKQQAASVVTYEPFKNKKCENRPYSSSRNAGWSGIDIM